MKRKAKHLKRQLMDQPVTMTPKELKKHEEKATWRAVNIMKLFPLMILRDMGWGKVRLERFLDKHNELVDSFNKGYITLEDIHKVLVDEVNLNVQEGGD